MPRLRTNAATVYPTTQYNPTTYVEAYGQRVGPVIVPVPKSALCPLARQDIRKLQQESPLALDLQDGK